MFGIGGPLRGFAARHREGLLLWMLLAASLLAVSHQVRDDSGASALRRGVLAVLAPAIGAVDSVTGVFSGIWHDYLYLFRVRSENRALQGEVNRLTVEVQELREAIYRAGRLEEFSSYQKATGLSGVPAQVIGESPDPWARTVIVNRGRRHGVETGFPVVTAEGLVGKVAEAGAESSVVRLITDRASGVPVLASRSRARAILEGENSGTCQLKYLLRTEDVKEGDRIITSGLEGRFPRGIEVGTVSQLVKGSFGLYQYAKVMPRVPFSRLEDVLVLTGDGGGGAP